MEKNGFRIVNTNRGRLRSPYRVTCSVKPLQILEDFKGLRFRTGSGFSAVSHNQSHGVSVENGLSVSIIGYNGPPFTLWTDFKDRNFLIK